MTSLDTKFDALELVVHPLHALDEQDQDRLGRYRNGSLYENFGKLWSVKGLRTEDYVAHASRLYQRVKRRIDAGIPVIAIYEKDDRERAESFFDEYADDVAAWAPTKNGSGKLLPEGEQTVRSYLSKLHEGGQVRISGELAGLCHGQIYDTVVEEVAEQDRGIRVREGQVFPHKPLKRENYKLYWADEHVIQHRGMF